MPSRERSALSMELSDEEDTFTVEQYWRHRESQALAEGRCVCWARGRACECKAQVEG